MLAAFRAGDLAEIAACATASAVLGQDAVPKRHLGALLAARARFNADGIFTAHTGSLLGYLFLREPCATRMGELSAFFRSLDVADLGNKVAVCVHDRTIATRKRAQIS